MPPERPTLNVQFIVENGDVIVRCFKDGRVSLTVRNVTETERSASVTLTYTQAQAVARSLGEGEVPDDDDD